MCPTDEDFSDADVNDASDSGRPVVKHVVKDLNTAVKMRRVQAQADASVRKAEAATALAQVKADERRRAQELKAEIQKIKLGMSAGEKARAHIAVAGPFYLLVLIGGFIVMLATGSIPEDQVSVASALLTLLVTGLMANLRSIIASEGGIGEEPVNGNGDAEPTNGEDTKLSPKSSVDKEGGVT